MISRRQFLTHSCSLGVRHGVGLAAALLNSAVASQRGRTIRARLQAHLSAYCSAGGNDSFNMLVPADDDQYGEYAEFRSDLALAAVLLLPLPGTARNGRHVRSASGHARRCTACLPTAMPRSWPTSARWSKRIDAAAAAAVRARLPLGLFSHADQINAVADRGAECPHRHGLGRPHRRHGGRRQSPERRVDEYFAVRQQRVPERRPRRGIRDRSRRRRRAGRELVRRWQRLRRFQKTHDRRSARGASGQRPAPRVLAPLPCGDRCAGRVRGCDANRGTAANAVFRRQLLAEHAADRARHQCPRCTRGHPADVLRHRW